MNRRFLLRQLLFATTAVAGVLGCGPGATVQRQHGSELEDGRRVPAAGYAYYAQAVVLEHQGQRQLARTAYDRARSADPGSGAAWAGLARSFCEEDTAQALLLFDRGLARAQERYPLYLARAKCRLSWHQFEEALEDARSALTLGPERAEASETVARAAEALGDQRLADATRRAFALYAGSPIRPERTRQSEEERQPHQGAADRALSSGDLSMAQSLSAGLLRPGELALRALALGQEELAVKQTDLVLAAAPDDPDANAARAIITPRSAAGAEPQPNGLSQLGGCLYASHLAVWSGPPTARLFLGRLPRPSSISIIELWQSSHDTLVRDCSRHLLTLTE